MLYCRCSCETTELYHVAPGPSARADRNIHTYTRTHTNTNVYTCARTHTHIYTQTHTYKCTHLRTQTHTHRQTYTRTHVHTHTSPPLGNWHYQRCSATFQTSTARLVTRLSRDGPAGVAAAGVKSLTFKGRAASGSTESLLPLLANFHFGCKCMCTDFHIVSQTPIPPHWFVSGEAPACFIGFIFWWEDAVEQSLNTRHRGTWWSPLGQPDTASLTETGQKGRMSVE